jgi:hypothetical protein
MPICTNCGSRQPEGAVFCDECGNPMQAQQPAPPSSVGSYRARTVVAPPPSTSLCPVCGAQIKEGEPFCTNCGASLLPAPVVDVRDVPTSPQTSDGATVVAGLRGGSRPQDIAQFPEVLPAPGTEEPPQFEQAIESAAAEVSPAPPRELRCATCGAELAPDSRFCDMCGAPTLASPAPKPPVAEEVGRTVLSSPQPVPPVAESERPPSMPSSWPESGDAAQVGRTVISSSEFSPFDVEEEPWSMPSPWPASGGADQGGRTVLSSPQPSPSGAEEAPAWPQAWESLPPTPEVRPASMVSGKFVVRTTHASLPFPPGRREIIIGREDPVNGIFPDIDLTDHGGDEGGVSRKHARVTLEGGQFAIEDLNSTNHTYVNRSRLGFGERRVLNDGDEVSFGLVKVIFQQL